MDKSGGIDYNIAPAHFQIAKDTSAPKNISTPNPHSNFTEALKDNSTLVLQILLDDFIQTVLLYPSIFYFTLGSF